MKRRFLHTLLSVLFYLSFVGVSLSVPDQSASGAAVQLLDIENESMPADGAIVSSTTIEGWITECADCPPDLAGMTDRSLRLDENELPHIAYGKDRLYYSWYEQGSWHHEVVDSSELSATSVALALYGSTPHIAYFDDLNDVVKHASKTGSTWSVQVVTTGLINYSGNVSVAVDSSGSPRISFMDNGSEKALKYAYPGSSSWTIETVEASLGESAGLTSLQMDGTGKPHISYYNSVNQGVRYAYKDGSGWHTETIDPQPTNGYENSLALTAAGSPRIVYVAFNGDASADLKYAYKDGAGWHTAIIDTTGVYAGRYPSIAVGGNGYAHVSYAKNDCMESFCGDLFYAYQDASGWHTSLAKSEGDTGWRSSIDLDGSDQPRIAYISNITEYSTKLEYADKSSGPWQTQVVRENGHSGPFNSLAIDSDGYPRASYYDQISQDLKYAWKDGSGWHTQMVDGEATNTGAGTSLALDSANRAHIGYFDASNGLLKYARQDETGWTVETVGSSGSDISLALDSSGNPQIAYGKKYAYRDGSGWHSETIPDLPQDCYSPSLGIDSQGNPHIALECYWDSLRYAHKDDSGWHVEIVASEQNHNASLDVDAQDRPHIAYTHCYTECGPFNLYYAYKDGGNWHQEQVLNVVPVNLSMQLDSAGNPHISYDVDESYTVHDLIHAYKDAGGWHTEITYDRNIPGQYQSLALDQNDCVYISHYDQWDNKLNITSQSSCQPVVVPVSPQSVLISGPVGGELDSSYIFSALVDPANTTQPVTFLWQATGDTDISHPGMGLSDSATFSWNTPGTKTVTITATTPYGQVTDTHTVTIIDVAVSGLSAANNGPVDEGEPVTLTAAATAGTNISYTWDFGDGETGSGATAVHIYNEAGVYAAIVTATNSAGQATATTSVTVNTVEKYLFLPLLMSRDQ